MYSTRTQGNGERKSQKINSEQDQGPIPKFERNIGKLPERKQNHCVNLHLRKRDSPESWLEMKKDSFFKKREQRVLLFHSLIPLFLLIVP